MASDEQIIVKSLTPEQIAKFGEYRDRFIAFGLSTKPADRKKAEKCIDEIYANAVPNKLPPPKKKVWVNSPLEGALMAQKLMFESKSNPTVDSVLECGFGQHDASWLAFYNFFATECKLESAMPVLPLAKLCEHAGWWWPFDEVCIISERPNQLKLNARGQLHSEDGPAISYPDDGKFRVYALNGVCVPEAYVTTPAKDLDPELILKEQNAEIRRELLRKITVERFIQFHKPKILDRKGDYELLEIQGLQVKMIYLKMINPSIKTFHIEGVDGECKTVQDAIDWRAGRTLSKGEHWEPSILT
jgi:hypothetical protein